MTESQLIQRAQHGSSPCFEELVRRYGQRLLGFLRGHVGNHADAEDLVQETFVRAYQHLGRYDSRYRFSTWLFVIGYRLAKSHQRRGRREITLDLREVAAGAEMEPPVTREEPERIWAEVRRLPAGQSEALWLKYGEDMSMAEIARVTGKSVVAVKVTLYRARRALAERLTRCALEEE